jgi:hypothetical protein
VHHLKSFLALICFFFFASAFSNGFSWHMSLGAGNPKFSSSSEGVAMNSVVDNQYSISTDSTSFLFGAGAAYAFDLAPFSLGLGASLYYINETDVTGFNSPFVNGGVAFDKLRYTATGKTTALFTRLDPP